MKKIIKEWKEWLMETKPTEKYLGQPTRPKSTRTELSPQYDRAAPDTMRQSDMRGTLKALLRVFFESNHGFGNIEKFNSGLDDHEKGLVVRDLNIMRYIYMGRTHFPIIDTDNVKSGTIFDNQPSVIGSPVEKIDAILDDLNFAVEQSVPSDADIEEIYIYYVKPNYATIGSEPAQATQNPFTSQMKFSADQLAQMNKDLWLRNKKRKK